MNLTWKQWHALEPTAYAVVCTPGSRWDNFLRRLPAQPAPITPPVQLASARLVGLHLRASGVSMGQLYLLTSTAILSCGFKPTAQHCQFMIDCPFGCPGLIDLNSFGSSSGDPVNLATGEEEYTPAPDLIVYNPTGPSVVWKRIYNSLRGGSNPANNPYPYNDFDFGMGWSHPYNVYVYDPDGKSTSTKYLVMPNGSRISFTAPIVPSSANPTVGCTVQANAPLLINWLYVAGSPRGAFTITWPDRTIWSTSPAAMDTFGEHLTQITDRNGHSIYINVQQGPNNRGMELTSISTAPSGGGTVLLSFAYSGPPTQLMLTSASDCYGRSVYYIDDYSKDAVSQVSQVVATGTASPPRRFLYGYLWPQNMGFFLQTITVPSPTGTGNSTATINYDSTGGTYMVTSTVDANGNKRVYSYGSGVGTITYKDSGNNIVTSKTFGFNADMSQTTVTDGAGTIIQTKTYADPNDRYQPSAVIDGNNNTWNLTWDQYGQPLTATSPRNTTTTYSRGYNVFLLGELYSVQTTGKQATSYSYYEPSGLLNTMTSPLPGTVNGTQSVTTSYQYDSLGNALSVKTPGNNATIVGGVDQGITTTYNYTTDGSYHQADAIGQPLTITNNLGKVTHLRYDARANLLSAVDALGNETDFQLNLADQNTLTTYPATGQSGTGRAYTYNNYLYTGGPLTYTAAYDESGNQIRKVNYGYGAEGETKTVTGSTEPVTYAYDAAYRLSSLADGNSHATRYYYNSAGYLDCLTYPGYSGPTPIYNAGTGTWSNVSGADSLCLRNYDHDGNAQSRIDGRGLTTTYSFVDPESRLTGITYPAGYTNLNVSCAYDSFGRFSSTADGTGSQSFNYDDLDLSTLVTTTYTGLAAQTLGYGYYPDGQRSGLSTPAGSFSYSYDAIGRLVGLSNPYSESSSWTYLDNNWLWTQQASTIVKTTFTLNARGLTTELVNTYLPNSSLLSDFGGTGTNQMKHDGVGNLTSLLANTPNSPAFNGTTSFSYDTKDQITLESSTRNGGYSFSEVYDNGSSGAGNPTTFRNGSFTYNVDNQRTDSSYDGNGNPTTYLGVACTFDPEDRMTSYGTALTMGYRADGLRAWKQDSSGNRTYFLHDGILPVVELNGTGAVSAVNTFGANGLLSRHVTGQLSQFYAFDPQGNASQRLDSNGTLLGSYLFEAFGTRTPNDTSGASFAGSGGQWGYYLDSETALQMVGHRYFDKATGRFVTRDPIGYNGGINLYNQCANNPANAIDPTGDQDHDSLGCDPTKNPDEPPPPDTTIPNIGTGTYHPGDIVPETAIPDTPPAESGGGALTRRPPYYPPGNGAEPGSGGPVTILPGTPIIQWSRPGGGGRYWALPGTPPWRLSLPPGNPGYPGPPWDVIPFPPPSQFTVKQPFECESGIASPWFNQPGGGYYSGPICQDTERTFFKLDSSPSFRVI